jgi:hypothetical protein
MTEKLKSLEKSNPSFAGITKQSLRDVRWIPSQRKQGRA